MLSSVDCFTHGMEFVEAMPTDDDIDKLSNKDIDDVRSGGLAETEWHRVKRQHQAIVESLNETPVSFTARSAEGLAMYRGIESHAINGSTRALAELGHEISTLRALGKPTDPDDHTERLEASSGEGDAP